MQFKEWLLFVESKQEKTLALELAGDAFQELNSVIPQNQRETDPLLLLAAYFYNKQKNLNQIKIDIQDYANLVKNQKMPLINVNLQNKSPDKPFDDYIYWAQIIHGHQGEEHNKQTKKFKPSDIDFQKEKPIETSQDGKIRVYKSNSPQQCIILGKGQTFCISQPGNTMWKSYRDTKGSTFYFVYDDTREDELSIVVVDASNNGIELTDKKNTTGTILDPFTGERTTDSNSYIKYLKEKGIDTSIFVNLPKTKEEIAEDKKLGQTNEYLNWFIALSSTEKSNYIGRGHLLTNEQFDYLWEHKFLSLLEQYAKTGLQLTDYQIDKIASKVELRKNYIHNRMIAQNNGNHINEKELQYLNNEQINKLTDDNVYYLLDSAKDKDATATLIINKKNKLTDNNVLYLLNYAENKNEIAKTLGLEKINKLTDETVYELLSAAENKDEMANILGSENINKLSDDNLYSLLTNANNPDEMAKIIIKYKKELTDDDVRDLLKYATDKDEIAKIIINNKKDLLTDKNVLNLLKHANNKDEMATLLGSEKINKLPDDDVVNLLLHANNKDEMAKTLGSENINKLSNDNVRYLLNNAKNKDEMAKILGSENINKLTDGHVYNLLALASAIDKDAMATLIINNKKELNDNNIIDLLQNTYNKDEMATLLGSEKINKLSNETVYVLLLHANNKDEMAKILGPENINKLNDNNVKDLLQNTYNKDEMATLLGSEKINKLTDTNVKDLLKYAKNKNEMKKILQQYRRI